MSLFSALFGGGDKMKKVPTMTKEQQRLLSQITNMLGGQGQLGQGYQGALGLQQQLMDPTSAAVQQFTEPYMQEFEQQTVPGLAERFAKAGGPMGGGLSSSGFGQALSTAGGNLQSQLAQLKSQLGQQAAGNLMQQFGGMSGQALSAKPFGYMDVGPGLFPSMMQNWAKGGFSGIGGGGNSLSDLFSSLGGK
jgi:hypothetical protein